MIPADLAARLRLLNEASFFNTDQPVSGLQRAREIQADLPELLPGQRLIATLQRPLPDGSFRALIAGREMTLSLNGAANPGDTLELEVSQVTPRAVFARIVGAEASATAGASAQPSLSQTGRLISFLLTGQPASSPAALGAGRALLQAPPASGAQLAPALREAIGQSGVFYEAHQVQWVLGKLDLAALQREPQNLAALASAGGAATNPPQTAAEPRTATAASTADGRANERSPAGDGAATPARAAAVAAIADEAAAPRAQPIPDRLLPVVHQQLNALATHQYVWQGQAWPGQPVEWIIHDPEDQAAGREQADAADAAPEWKTTLRLTLPRLGGVEAQLHLTAAGVALRMRTADPATMAALQDHRDELQSALEAANLSLAGMVVEAQ
ncbi:MAG: flagellar hook-length control protein FliK [Proteobacteria bacterium]|nr:flagellar hook-length control protein FliK [Pseudomonadota bacterium]